MSANVRFEERQRFRQPWVWILIAVAAASGIGGILAGTEGPTTAAIGLAILGGVAGLLWVAALTTQVRPDGIYVQFFPRHLSFRRIGWDDLDAVETRHYSPLRAFGGWGLRWRPGRVAYTVSGDHAVVLRRRNDRNLWLGTEQPRAFVDAIDEARPYS